MIKTILKLVLIATLFVACKGKGVYAPKNLTKLTNDQIMEMAKTKTFPIPANLVYKDPKGGVLTLDSLGRIPDASDYFQNYYKNAEGVIKEVVVSKATPEQKAFNLKLQETFRN